MSLVQNRNVKKDSYTNGSIANSNSYVTWSQSYMNVGSIYITHITKLSETKTNVE